MDTEKDTEKRPIGWIQCTECKADYPVDPFNLGPRCPHCGAEDAQTMAELPDQDPIEVPAALLAFIVAHAPKVISNGGGAPFAVVEDDDEGGEVVELHNARKKVIGAIDLEDREGNVTYRGYILRVVAKQKEVRLLYGAILAATLRIRGDKIDDVLWLAREMIDGWYPQPGTAPGELAPPPGARRR